jgi:hypothetical protein
MEGGTNRVVYEKYVITLGSYAGDGPMPGLVHRGIPIPEMPRRDKHQYAFGFPGMPIEDTEPTVDCHKYLLQGDTDFYLCEPDSWKEIKVTGDKEIFTNPYSRPQLFAVATPGAISSYYLNVMGESRE